MSNTHTASHKQYFPRAGVATDGWSTDEEATATCYCGKVQLSFPTQGPGFLGSFVCNCSDCHKITASMFATNFRIDDAYLKHLRGRDNLTRYCQSDTIYRKGASMTNYFCSSCGSLMYRVASAFPNMSILRVGTVDDFTLHETKLRPTKEYFVKERNNWVHGLEGSAQQFQTMPNL